MPGREIERLEQSIKNCQSLEDILEVDMTSQIEELKEQLNKLIKGC